MSNRLKDDLPLVALLDDLWNHASAKWRIAHLKWDCSDVHHRSFWKKSLWHDIAALIANVILCKYRNSPHVFVHIQICYTSCSSKHMTLNITTYQFSKHASTYITSSFFDMLSNHNAVTTNILMWTAILWLKSSIYKVCAEYKHVTSSMGQVASIFEETYVWTIEHLTSEKLLLLMLHQTRLSKYLVACKWLKCNEW